MRKKVTAATVLLLGCLGTVFAQQPAQTATVWFYSPANSGQTRTVYQIGGITDRIATIAPGQFFGLRVSPGTHVFSYTQAPGRGQSVAVAVNQGQQAYVEVQRDAFLLATQASGVQAIQASQPIPVGSAINNSVIVAGPAPARTAAPPPAAVSPTPAAVSPTPAAAAGTSQTPQPAQASSVRGIPRVEVFGGYSLIQPDLPSNLAPGEEGEVVEEVGQFLLGNVLGWGASATVNINDYFGITGDIAGHNKSLSGSFEGTTGEAKLSLHTFLFGPTFKFRRRVEPFFHVLFGVGRPSASASAKEGNTTTEVDFTETGLAMAFGGGVDIPISNRVAWRAIEADYFPYRTSSGDTFTFHNIRWRSGIVFRFGQ
jgi:hypothetical protein